MAVTRQQVVTASNPFNGATTFSSLNIPIGTAPQANSLLIAAWALDKSAGTFTAPSGWTTLLSRPGASVSLLIVYKIATGAETGAAASWSTPILGAVGYVAEYRGVDTATPLGPNALESAYSDTARTSIAFAPSASTAAGIAVAIIGIDTDWGTGFQPTATGYTQATKVGVGDGAGSPGIVLDEATISASGATTAPTFSWSTSDQVQGALLQIRQAGTTSFSGSPALTGSGALTTASPKVTTSGTAPLTGTGTMSAARVNIARRQLVTATNPYDGSTTFSSLAVPIGTAPTVNNLLLASWVIDKSSGTITAPSGWTTVLSRAGASVSTYIGYKIATGAETTVSLSWATPSLGAVGTVVEYSGVDASSPLGPNDLSTYSDTAVTSLGFAPTAPTADGLALAVVGIDTINTNGGFNIAATGYTLISSTSYSTGTGAPGLALSEKRVTAGATNSPTFTWTDTDQVNGALLQLRQTVSTSVYSGTATLTGSGALGVSGFQTLTAPTSLGGQGILGGSGSGTASGTSTAGYIEMWTGTAWVPKPIKMWTGSAWVIKPLKMWTGTAWVPVTAP